MTRNRTENEHKYRYEFPISQLIQLTTTTSAKLTIPLEILWQLHHKINYDNDTIVSNTIRGEIQH